MPQESYQIDHLLNSHEVIIVTHRSFSFFDDIPRSRYHGMRLDGADRHYQALMNLADRR
jgi:hypothetical protein